MQPQVGLQFLIEGPGGFQNANVIVTETEAKTIIRNWSSKGERTGVLRGDNGSWAVLMDNVRGIFIFSLTPPPGNGGQPQRPFPGNFVSGN